MSENKSYQQLIADHVFLGGASDVAAMVEQDGVQVIVDLREESTGCATAGVIWTKVPLGDDAVQDQVALFKTAIDAVVAAYRAGQKVGFHCGGGKGRTGTVAVGVLLELGLCQTLEQAEAKAKTIRPVISLKPAQRAALVQLYPQTQERTAMKTIQIFDPALCCSTGVCGVDVDQALVSFSADVDWARQHGANIERFNLAQQPLVFAENETVRAFLERSGQEGLPLVLVGGELALAGRYPRRAELARWAGISQLAVEVKPASGCCSGSSCC